MKAMVFFSNKVKVSGNPAVFCNLLTHKNGNDDRHWVNWETIIILH